jgi:serine acetyltransferase
MRPFTAATWEEPEPLKPVPFQPSLRADIVAHVPLNCREMPRPRWVWTTFKIAMRSSGFHAVLLYRLAHSARSNLGLMGRVLSGLCFWFCRHWYGCSLASSARLYGGLIMPHPQGIVIGPGVVVGPRSWIFQNVTLGGNPGKVGLPVIGSDVRIYAGAVITGPVTVGDNVVIGANGVVSADVGSRTMVRQLEMTTVSLPERFLADSE